MQMPISAETTDDNMKPGLVRKVELCSAWCGVAYLALLFSGWFLAAGFYPMHRPSAGAAEIARIFQVDSFRIRVGMVEATTNTIA